jgi:hypothetical protein
VGGGGRSEGSVRGGRREGSVGVGAKVRGVWGGQRATEQFRLIFDSV